MFIAIIFVMIIGIAIWSFMFNPKIYHDESSGIAIEYSSGWIETELTPGDNILSSEDGSAFITITKADKNGKSLSEFFNEYLALFNELDGFEIIESQKTIVAGMNSEERVFIFDDDSDVTKIKLVVAESNQGVLYLVGFVTSGEDYDREIENFNKMIESVRVEG